MKKSSINKDIFLKNIEIKTFMKRYKKIIQLKFYCFFSDN